MKIKSILLVGLLPLILTNAILAQDYSFSKEALESAPYLFRKQFQPKMIDTCPVMKKPGHYSKTDWASVIDSVWGPGLPVDEKLAIFDTFVEAMDEHFACFQNLECDQQLIDWNAMAAAYRQEIEDTVSRGRFAAIMHQLCLATKEAHTYADDSFVMNGYALAPGLPLLVVGGWGNNTHFGAGLTPLPDSSLLVYDAVENHVLGLQPGDIVLGYDGILWKDLYKEMIGNELPIWGWWWGSAESAHVHSWLMSAGMNWHLFDTIDIVKYTTSETLHLPTSLLEQQNTAFFCGEMLPVPGIEYPDLFNQELFSYGIVEGTNIGYIYGWGWYWDAENEFYQAVFDLMENYETSGLIIDFRMNYGGNMFLSNPGLELLFNTQDTTIAFVVRNNPDDHCSWASAVPLSGYIIPGDPQTFYDKPIAVLTGPGAVSSGDQVALRMTFHPMVRVFGKSTTAAFNAPTNINFPNPFWAGRYANSDAYLVSEPGNNLTHEEFPVDEDVWQTQEAVVQGKDAVVDAAIEWIDQTTTGTKDIINDQLSDQFELKIWPNPSNGIFNLSFNIKKNGLVLCELFEISGARIKELMKKEKNAGKYSMAIDLSDLQPGIYFCVLKTSEGVLTKKLIKLH
jgi:hypothetical protein